MTRRFLWLVSALLILSGCCEKPSGGTFGSSMEVTSRVAKPTSSVQEGRLLSTRPRHIRNFDQRERSNRSLDEPYAHLGFYTYGCVEYGFCVGAGTKGGGKGGKPSRSGSKFVGRK